MNNIYHWTGFVVFWGAVCAAAIVCAWGVWDAEWFRSTKRRFANAKLLVKVLFGYRFPMSKRITELAPYFGRKADWWKRDLICYCIRHSRKHGYTEPE